MSILMAVLTLFVIVSMSFSQNITISGKVTDTGTTALSGAVVKLEKYGLTATTGADGSFSLTSTSGINSGINQLKQHRVLASTGNGVIYLQLQERGQVEIITYTLQGKAVSKVQKAMDIGTYSIVKPYMGNGVYLYKIKAGNSELIIKSPSIGRVSGGTGLSTHGILSTATMSRASSYVPINDVIAVTKDGYLNYRVILTNSDTSDIEIKMTVCAGTVTDIDGNVYQTVKIGNQEWTVENLRVTKYNDGTPITLDTSTVTWENATTEKYCYYNNTTNADTIKKWGALYNWYVVSTTNPKKIAPAGWHVPTRAEWRILEKHLVLNGYNWDGTTDTTKENLIAKSMATKTDWLTDTTQGNTGCELTNNNKSGFSGLPGGCRGFDVEFYDLGRIGNWWSTTEDDAIPERAWFRYLYYRFSFLYRYSTYKSFGFSVRLIKD